MLSFHLQSRNEYHCFWLEGLTNYCAGEALLQVPLVKANSRSLRVDNILKANELLESSFAAFKVISLENYIITFKIINLKHWIIKMKIWFSLLGCHYFRQLVHVPDGIHFSKVENIKVSPPNHPRLHQLPNHSTACHCFDARRIHRPRISQSSAHDGAGEMFCTNILSYNPKLHYWNGHVFNNNNNNNKC